CADSHRAAASFRELPVTMAARKRQSGRAYASIRSTDTPVGKLLASARASGTNRSRNERSCAGPSAAIASARIFNRALSSEDADVFRLAGLTGESCEARNAARISACLLSTHALRASSKYGGPVSGGQRESSSSPRHAGMEGSSRLVCIAITQHPVEDSAA